MFWACCLEQHEDSGWHFHASVKLGGKGRRWLPVKKRFAQLHGGVQLNFSGGYNGYGMAHRYLCKEDTEVFRSPAHPDLSEIGAPRTSAVTRKRQEVTVTTKTDADGNEETTRVVRSKSGSTGGQVDNY